MAFNPKSLANLKAPWQPGQSGNPTGRRGPTRPCNAPDIEIEKQVEKIFQKAKMGHWKSFKTVLQAMDAMERADTRRARARGELKRAGQ